MRIGTERRPMAPQAVARDHGIESIRIDAQALLGGAPGIATVASAATKLTISRLNFMRFPRR
jgi:hypothetical protein